MEHTFGVAGDLVGCARLVFVGEEEGPVVWFVGGLGFDDEEELEWWCCGEVGGGVGNEGPGLSGCFGVVVAAGGGCVLAAEGGGVG